ncbi:MAG: ParA family protein [Methylococcales bacterium]
MRILTFINQKGGVGKTSVSFFTSDYFASIRNERVLCIDLDPQCNLSNLLIKMDFRKEEEQNKEYFIPPIHPDYNKDDPEQANWDGRGSSADFWLNAEGAEIYPTRIPNISLIPGHGLHLKRLEDMDELRGQIEDHLRGILLDPGMALDEMFDVIVIDTSPEIKPVTISGLRSATDIVIPCEMSELDTQGLAGMLSHFNSENIERIAVGEKPLNLAGILANKFRKQSTSQYAYYNTIKQDELLGPYLLDDALPFYSAYQDAMQPNAKSIFALKKSAYQRKELENICESICHRMGM